MYTEYQSEDYDEAFRNIADFMDALEHGEQATVEKTISDRKEMPTEQTNTNRIPSELGSSILQMNPPSGGLSPLQVVQASTTIGPYIDPIGLYMHSHAMEAILQPERSFQVPKSDLHYDKRPAVPPVQVVQHHQDLISEDVKMGGTINFCSHLPILSTELHGKGRASPVSQVDGTTWLGDSNGELDGLFLNSQEPEGFQRLMEGIIAETTNIYPKGSSLVTEYPKGPPVCQTTGLGDSNGELDGLFFNSQQADCLLLNSSVFGPEEPEGFQRLMEGIIAETTNIYPKGSSLVTESPKGPPVCQTTLLGVSNGELDGLFFNSQQADWLLLNSSVLGPYNCREPELESFQRLMEGIIAETTNIYPKGSSLVTESPKGPPVCQEAILQPERSFQVPKSDLHLDKRPAVSPVQVEQHHQDLISEDVKMGGTINFCSHLPLPILSTELHGKGRASSVSQVDGTTGLGDSNGELDGLFFNSQQADSLFLNSSVFGPEEPEIESFQRLMEGIIAETTNIYPKGSSLVTESLKGAPVCQMESEGRGECSRNDISPTFRRAQGWNVHDFDLNQSLQSRRHIITYSLYDQRYEALGLPIDPILRMFAGSDEDWNGP